MKAKRVQSILNKLKIEDKVEEGTKASIEFKKEEFKRGYIALNNKGDVYVVLGNSKKLMNAEQIQVVGGGPLTVFCEQGQEVDLPILTQSVKSILEYLARKHS